MNGQDDRAHDCVACTRLIEKYQSCEAMHKVNPQLCKCKLTKKRVIRNEQSTLNTPSKERTRFRYWMKKIRQGEL